MKDFKEPIKNACNKTGEFIKDHRGVICFAVGLAVGKRLGIFETGLVIQIKAPEAWEIIMNRIA